VPGYVLDTSALLAVVQDEPGGLEVLEILASGVPGWRHVAAQVKATYSLSVADAWIASLAILRSARLVHRDPEYDAIEGLRSLRLPER
jgi:predicted nucleic acid-binding protein